MLANGTGMGIMPLFRTDPLMATLAFVATDILLIIGAGLFVGRNSRIIEYYYKESDVKLEDVKLVAIKTRYIQDTWLF